MKNVAFICYVLFLSASLVMPQSKTASVRNGLTLTIHPHGWATGSGNGAYFSGKPISIRSVWKNTGKRPISFLLKDHDAYFGTLAYPLFVWVKITDSTGNVLTENDAESGLMAEGWYANWLLGGDAFIYSSEMPGDIITLKSNEEVTRIIPLDKLLAGLKGLPNGLESGKYTIEFYYSDVLKDANLTSNKLEIKVTAEK